ncbi:MAG: HEPN domain-containing protein [Bacteroidales bacterium]|nr:HEPN domain-containing protein [Bacteroidales bacterium]
MSKFKIEKDILPSLEAAKGLNVLTTFRSPYISSWYEVANENIKTANILLENNRICHATFFIQQALECIIKGLFLENGVANTSDLESISHYPNKAIRSYYLKVNDKYGVKFCDKIVNVLNKGQNFYEKIDLAAQIANLITEQYNDNLTCKERQLAVTYSPKALGLGITATQEECHLRAYKLYYFQYILTILSYVFNHDVESNARYPQYVDNKTVLTPTSYVGDKVRENLKLVQLLIEHIIKEVTETSWSIVYWADT